MTTEIERQLDVPHLVLEAYARCQDAFSTLPLEYYRVLSEQIEGDVCLILDWIHLEMLTR